MFVKRFPYNSLIGYININSVKEKVISLREVLMLLQILLAQMKLNQTRVSQIINLRLKAISFCHPEEIETQREGGKLVYLQEGFIPKKNTRTGNRKKPETICIEITIAKKKWCILFTNCPPNFSKTEFLEEVSVAHPNL